MKPATKKRRPPLAWLIPAILTGSAVPFVLLAIRAATGSLGANPIATALNQLGMLALVFLVTCLSCTPLKLIFGWTWPMRIRRTLGLLGFFTALSHFLLYVVLDQGLAWSRIVQDIAKRPFIALGFTALVLLVPMALTSNKKAILRLGHARWKRVHRLVYVVIVLAVAHFFLRVKADITEPLLYGALVALLFFVRVANRARSWMTAAVSR
jgi:sulfoxide reductase heme-binding subunit YedZ